MVSPCKAVGLARGNINPLTHEVMDTFSPSKVLGAHAHTHTHTDME